MAGQASARVDTHAVSARDGNEPCRSKGPRPVRVLAARAIGRRFRDSGQDLKVLTGLGSLAHWPVALKTHLMIVLG